MNMKETPLAALSALVRLEILQQNLPTHSLHFSSRPGSLGVGMEKVNWSIVLGLGFGGEDAMA